MRVIFSGGGTGGHLYPGIAIASILEKKGYEFIFYVSNRGIERRILSKYDYNFIEQDIRSFVGESLVGKFKSLWLLFKQIIKLWGHVKAGDKVVLLGGFASAPIAFIALLKGADIYLHEQNSVMGRINRLFARFAKKVFTSYPDTLYVDRTKTICTGNPVRSDYDGFVFKENFEKSILIVGGSQGSRFINQLIVNSIEPLMNLGFTVYHQTGLGLYDETVELYGDCISRYTGRLEVVAYIDDMAKRYTECGLVVSRAGSGSLFETMYAKRPAIYIPFKHASDNHQYFNAVYMASRGIAFVLEENDADVSSFIRYVSMIEDRYEPIKNNFRDIEFLDSASIIVENMEL